MIDLPNDPLPVIKRCPFCKAESFQKDEYLLTGPGLTFLRLEFLSETAVVFTCQKCGFTMWFRTPSRMAWGRKVPYLIIMVLLLIIICRLLTRL